jgi:DNA-directed RNA polymerase subunit RPC12/RpoP
VSFLQWGKSMKRRLTFKCWKCDKTYTLLRELNEKQELLVACPYCGSQAVADLKPFIHKVKPIIRIDEPEKAPDEFVLRLPDVIPTQPRE